MNPTALHRPPTRRQSLSLLSACALAPAWARAAEPRRCAVVSLLGDEMVLVYAAPVTGTSLDRNGRRTLADTTGSLDKIALAATGKAIETYEAGARAVLLTVPPSPLHQTPETLFDGSSITLPGSLVNALDQAQATHVVLLTKHRGPASIALADSKIGVGALRGLGYYIDRVTGIRMVESGHTGTGLLAAYVYMRLTLADARTGAVLRQRLVAATRAYPVASSERAVDPWEVLTAQQKVAGLRGLLESRLAEEIPALMATT